MLCQPCGSGAKQAYYCCIAQLLSSEGHHEKPPVEISGPSTPEASCVEPDAGGGDDGSAREVIYVCGDSHTLTPAWREVKVGGRRVCVVCLEFTLARTECALGTRQLVFGAEFCLVFFKVVEVFEFEVVHRIGVCAVYIVPCFGGCFVPLVRLGRAVVLRCWHFSSRALRPWHCETACTSATPEPPLDSVCNPSYSKEWVAQCLR